MTMNPAESHARFNTFDDVSRIYSRKIYSAFVSGRIINQAEYSEAKGDFTECLLYQELIKNEAHYQLLYSHLGYQLEHDSEAEVFFVNELVESDDDSDDFSETTLKTQAILILLGHMLATRGQPLSSLADPNYGITNEDCRELDDYGKTAGILKALKLKSGEDAVELLRKRGYAFRVGTGRLVLSKGASVFLQRFVDDIDLGSEL